MCAIRFKQNKIYVHLYKNSEKSQDNCMGKFKTKT